MAKLNILITSLLLALSILHFPQYSTSQGQNIDPVIKAIIDDFIETVFLPESRTSSLALAIVQNNGEVLYTTGYGFADQEKGIPNGNETQFLIGSITKSITSTIVVKVLSEKYPELGEAVLDIPVGKLLTDTTFTLIDRFRSEHISFRDLLAHRVCTFTDDVQMDAEAINTTGELVYRQRYAEEICGVRTDFTYNNAMYVVAGELIGLIANQPYEDLVQSLLVEIGMLNSTFVKRTDDLPNMDYRAKPYYVLANVVHPMNIELPKRLEPYNAAGGVVATSNDMAKYMQFRLNLGNVEGRQVIPEDVMMWLQKPANHLPQFSYKSEPTDFVINQFAYGLGLGISSFDGFEHYVHSGYFPPYNSFMSLFPTQNLGIFISSNQAPVLAPQVAIHSFIFNALSGAPDAEEKAVALINQYKIALEAKTQKREEFLAKMMHERKSISSDKKQNEIIGKYGSGSGGDLEIYEKFNEATNATGLYLSYGNWAQAWVETFEDNLYKLVWDSDMIQDFYSAGDPEGLIFISVSEGVLQFLMPFPEGMVPLGSFELGVSLDTLPPIPWNPGSCGPGPE